MAKRNTREDAPSTRVAEETARLIKLARERGASDLHLEPDGEGLHVRMRLDGVLHEVECLPADLVLPVLARLKFLADLLTYRKDIPQEGRLREADLGIEGDVRLSTFPTIHGERAVIRFFDRSGAALELDALNLPPDALDGLRRALAATSGVVLLTGPAGSGKTTTLYAALNAVRRRAERHVHVITVEDPVETILPGVTQTQVNAAAGLTYSAALRSLVRQDPEVIMVGEIRDIETARIVAQAGLTGHLVLSTLHGGDVATVIARLIDMGIEPSTVTSALRAVFALRLVRQVCGECRAEGCRSCGGTGYRGRLPLVEFAHLSGAVRKLILHSADAEGLARQLAAEGMTTLRDRAGGMLDARRTTAEEVERVLGPSGSA